MEYFDHITSNNVTVIRFHFSHMGFRTRQEIQDEMDSLITPENNKFVLNLEKIGFLASLVVAVLIHFQKELAALNGKVVLSNIPEKWQTVIEVTHLDQIFDIYGTEEEALQAFS